EKGFQFLEEGSFRMVYAFPNGEPYVLKISTGRGDIMKKREVDPIIQTKYAEILPKMYIKADDYKWIVVEKVRPARNEDVAKEISNSNFGARKFMNFLGAIKEYTKNSPLRLAIKGAMEELGIPYLSPTLNKMIDYSIEYNIQVFDLWLKNLGVSEDGRLVILDSSFADDIRSNGPDRF
ncbi:MAG: hypothetical protein NUV97_03140, partial [archaeon]|nr:hypothetical protein [archaeon]